MRQSGPCHIWMGALEASGGFATSLFSCLDDYGSMSQEGTSFILDPRVIIMSRPTLDMHREQEISLHYVKLWRFLDLFVTAP